MARPLITELTADETIVLLDLLPEELRQTPYTRGGLIIELAILWYKTSPLVSSDTESHRKAEEYLKRLVREGSREDKDFLPSGFLSD